MLLFFLQSLVVVVVVTLHNLPVTEYLSSERYSLKDPFIFIASYYYNVTKIWKRKHVS